MYVDVSQFKISSTQFVFDLEIRCFVSCETDFSLGLFLLLLPLGMNAIIILVILLLLHVIFVSTGM